MTPEFTPVTPPRCLESFAYQQVFAGVVDDVFILAYALSCPCGRSFFSGGILCRGDAETGVVLVCRVCRAAHRLFDVTVDGCDGEWGSRTFLRDLPVEVRPLGDKTGEIRFSRVVAVFTFSVPWRELSEIARSYNKPWAQFFDWFTVFDGDFAAFRDTDGLWACECA
ncbi:hypothetical protein ABAC402_09785 [Asticcacaulis sp. AC402]|nr:hypothetical protein ABAC402_09785 [Asticcacaulis sp. AC402]